LRYRHRDYHRLRLFVNPDLIFRTGETMRIPNVVEFDDGQLLSLS